MLFPDRTVSPAHTSRLYTQTSSDTAPSKEATGPYTVQNSVMLP